ncbi:type II secretion system protein [Phragmitibacter flavus]|uniref:Type II secretion system protein n=1 Tax=Phragmitibacter flavus TaxID=2576071 RepID=A0A5R8KI58_9BACT|nr:type II secretion system protein [Phragmitibacter flavus]TLD71299.1 type II secretion system protein [Phragmitibacter flavus]
MQNLFISSPICRFSERGQSDQHCLLKAAEANCSIEVKGAVISQVMSVRLQMRRGFTLMEVVVTLGIFALFVGVLGLFPQLMNVSAESAIETRAAHIAQQVVRDLVPALHTLPPVDSESTDPDGHPPSVVPYGTIVSEVTIDGGQVETVDLRESGVHTGHYDLEGLPVAVDDVNARLRVEVKITPEANRIGICQVEVRVRSLSASPETPAHRFFTKATFPRKEGS